MTDVQASAPASSANLGPGFDTVALALDLHCTVRAEPSTEWSIDHVGPEKFLGDRSDDGILAAAQRVSEQPLSLEVENHIPLTRGLGSSAAAFTAGSLAALRANGHNPDHDELFQIVTEMEGHPDNAAAAVYGGLVAVSADSVIHLTLSRDLIPVLAVPGSELNTKAARQVLPSAYDIDVVARTLGRYTGLIEGLRAGSRELLALAAGDELHEMPRAPLNPAVAALMDVARDAGALHTARSGAGPSVLSLTTDDNHEAVVSALEATVGEGGRVLVLPPDMLGAR